MFLDSFGSIVSGPRRELSLCASRQKGVPREPCRRAARQVCLELPHAGSSLARPAVPRFRRQRKGLLFVWRAGSCRADARGGFCSCPRIWREASAVAKALRHAARETESLPNWRNWVTTEFRRRSPSGAVYWRVGGAIVTAGVEQFLHPSHAVPPPGPHRALARHRPPPPPPIPTPRPFQAHLAPPRVPTIPRLRWNLKRVWLAVTVRQSAIVEPHKTSQIGSLSTTRGALMGSVRVPAGPASHAAYSLSLLLGLS